MELAPQLWACWGTFTSMNGTEQRLTPWSEIEIIASLSDSRAGASSTYSSPECPVVVLPKYLLPAGRVWHLSVLLISLNAYTESAQGNLETVLLLLGFLFLNHLNASHFFNWSGEWNTSIPGFVCFAVFGRLNLSQDHSSCCCCAEFPLYDGRAGRKQGDRSWGTKAIGHFPMYFSVLSHCWSIIIPLICLSLGIISREELRMGECASLHIHHRLGFAVLTRQFLCLLCYRIL